MVPAGRSNARTLYRFAFAAYVVLLLLFVLSPMPPLPVRISGASLDPTRWLAVAWLADALRNLFLFMPIGFAVVRSGRSPVRALAIGSALSLTIELIQLGIPGRFPSPADLISNALGAYAGAQLTLTSAALVDPSTDTARRASLWASAATVAFLAFAAFLLQPTLPDGTYYGGWTADLGNLEAYSGHVIEARIGRQGISQAGPVRDSPALRRALGADEAIFVRAIAGTEPTALAPIITIHDGHHREILLVGAQAEDLVVGRLLRSFEMGFENPRLRFLNALAGIEPGEAFTLRLTRNGARWQIERDDIPIAVQGRTAGRSWELLAPTFAIQESTARVISTSWMASLIFPAAFWVRRNPTAWLGIGSVALMLVTLPWLGAVSASPLHEWLGLVVGVAAGLECSRRAGPDPKSRP